MIPDVQRCFSGGLVQGQQPAGFVRVQSLHHPAVEDRDPPARGGGRFPGRHDARGIRGLRRRNAENLVGGGDLGRVDQCLAVESERLALPAGFPKSRLVTEIRENPIQYIKTPGPGRQHAVAERGK